MGREGRSPRIMANATVIERCRSKGVEPVNVFMEV